MFPETIGAWADDRRVGIGHRLKKANLAFFRFFERQKFVFEKKIQLPKSRFRLVPGARALFDKFSTRIKANQKTKKKELLQIPDPMKFNTDLFCVGLGCVGASRGFAFVEFGSVDEAKAWMEAKQV